MDRKSSILVSCALLVALVGATAAPIARSDDDEGAKAPSRAGASQSVAAPVVVAQGRCFNGRCY
jgi:hypothetical protein